MERTALPSGIALDELDASIRPQDDLYLHVNQRWLERTEIPADRARYGAFHRLHEAAEEAVREIIEAAQQAEPGSETRKFGDLYTSFMDEARIEALGTAPLQPLLAEADALHDIAALVRALGRNARSGGASAFGLFVDNDPGDPEHYRLFVQQGGLGLPDESYYREEHFAEIRTAYQRHVQRMLELAGLDRAAERAGAIMALETELAGVHWDNVRSRDAVASYNLLDWAGVAELWQHGEAELEDWAAAFAAPEGAMARLVVRQPEFFSGLGRLLAAERLDAWRDWFRWHTVRASAPYLSAAFVEANFDFYGRTLTGTPMLRERWKRGVGLVEQAMGEAVGREYVARHFPPAAKAAMDALVESLIEAYRRSIDSLEWMGEATRAEAQRKLAKFTPKIGYPSRWRDYSALSVDAGDLLGNVRAVQEFETQRELAKLGGPVDREEWFMTPQTVNAYYNPGFNEIVFPAAILQLPFFDASRDAAANYGAIGAVIGHEISHGFDDQGSKYDGDGRLHDWWTEADRAAFDERAAAVIAQYDALSPAQSGGIPVNGALTIGENIADISGLAIAWKAYQLSLDGAEPPVVDGIPAAQRFFLSWAQAWQQKSRDEEVVRLLAIDPHSPAEFRCNQVVRNLEAFYDAFKLEAGDTLWMQPDERVSLW